MGSQAKQEHLQAQTKLYIESTVRRLSLAGPPLKVAAHPRQAGATATGGRCQTHVAHAAWLALRASAQWQARMCRPRETTALPTLQLALPEPALAAAAGTARCRGSSRPAAADALGETARDQHSAKWPSTLQSHSGGQGCTAEAWAWGARDPAQLAAQSLYQETNAASRIASSPNVK